MTGPPPILPSASAQLSHTDYTVFTGTRSSCPLNYCRIVAHHRVSNFRTSERVRGSDAADFFIALLLTTVVFDSRACPARWLMSLDVATTKSRGKSRLSIHAAASHGDAPNFRKRSRTADHHDATTSSSGPQKAPPPQSTTTGSAQAAATAKTAHAPLPVDAARGHIVDLVRSNRCLVIVGETGCGKTTQIPQYLLDDMLLATSPSSSTKAARSPHHNSAAMVAVTQPRRVAAISVARYVAQLRGCPLGGEVGYAVRFDDTTTVDTRLKFMTDGVLMREMLLDPSLSRYRFIVLDEAHERTLHGDFLFGLIKRLLTQRDDLTVIVMSATLNAAAFSKFWNHCPVGYIQGRSFPVDVFYASEPQADYVDAALNTIIQIHLEEGPGDVLCFLTGQDEITDAVAWLEKRHALLPHSALKYVVLGLYSAMGPQQQMRIFEPAPPGCRKIILATNIAETSITIEGIRYVVDTGMVKQKTFNPATSLESLRAVPVSRAQARQRAGRAGRLTAGKCYRLFQEDEWDSLLENTIPEIARANLASVVLQMKAMRIDNVMQFDFMDRPSDAALLQAMSLLLLLGAIEGSGGPADHVGRITPLGLELARFPLDPCAARALLKGRELGVGLELCAIYAMLSAESVFVANGVGSADRADAQAQLDAARSEFARSTGDHVTYLHIFDQFVRQPKGQRVVWCHSVGLHFKHLQTAVETHKQLADILLFHRSQSHHLGRTTTAPLATGSNGNSAASMAVPPSGGGYEASPDWDEAPPTGTPSAKRKSTTSISQQYFTFSRHEAFSDYNLVRRAICAGYFMNAAVRNPRDGAFTTMIGHQAVSVHPSSVLFRHSKRTPLLIYHTAVQTSKLYMRDIVAVREEMLIEAAPTLLEGSRPKVANAVIAQGF